MGRDGRPPTHGGPRGIPVVGRRAVLAISAGGLAAALCGCGLRWEDDAPLPFLRRREMPDETLLIAATRRAWRLADLSAGVAGSPTAAAAAERHRRQVGVLRTLLAGGGVPDSLVLAPGIGTSSTTRLPATRAVATAGAAVPAGELARQEASVPVVDSATDHRALLISLVAHDAATAVALGAAPEWGDAESLPSPAAALLLAHTRSALYAAQVATAQLPGGQRASARTVLAALTAREAGLATLAGAPAPPAPLGYRLPFPITGPDDARRLLTSSLGALVAGGLEPLGHVAAGSSAARQVAARLAEAVGIAASWGVAPTAFPGMSAS